MLSFELIGYLVNENDGLKDFVFSWLYEDGL